MVTVHKIKQLNSIQNQSIQFKMIIPVFSNSDNSNHDEVNWVDECIRKKFAPGKVFSLQFMCMDTILRNTEHTIEKDMEESRTVCNLDNSALGYEENNLLELLVTFYTTRSLVFTPSVYLFMVRRREAVRSMFYTAPCGFSYQLDEDWFTHLLENNPGYLYNEYYKDNDGFKYQYYYFFIIDTLVKRGVYKFLLDNFF